MFWKAFLILVLFNGVLSQNIFDFDYYIEYTIQSQSASPIVNVEVLVEVDTYSLIQAGKLDNQCNGIRFRESGTWLNYWPENSCNINGSPTRYWVVVPSIGSFASSTISIYYGNSLGNGEQSWNGNFYVLSQSTCSSGSWNDEPKMHDKFWKYTDGTFGEIVNGTNVIHTHVASGSTSTFDDYPQEAGVSGNFYFCNKYHEHDWDFLVDESDASPPYKKLFPCKSNKFDIFVGSIHMFKAKSYNGAHFMHYSLLEDVYPYGSNICCDEGGSISHDHQYDNVTEMYYSDWNGIDNTCCFTTVGDHDHIVSGSVNSRSNIPRTIDVLFSLGISTSAFPNDDYIVVGDTKPLYGWEEYTNSNFNNRFIRGSFNNFGSTTVSSFNTNHDHSYTLNIDIGLPQVREISGSGSNAVTGHNHDHDGWGDTSYSSYTLPYFSVKLFHHKTKLYNEIGWGSEESVTCPPGQYRIGITCVDCPQGTYKLNGGLDISNCLNCTEGTYSNIEGRTTVCSDLCDEGYYCYTGSISSTSKECGVGYYCTGGLRYECLGGEFANETTLNECYDCPERFYCPVGGCINPIECTETQYCPIRSSVVEECQCNSHGSCYTSVNDCHCFGGWSDIGCTVSNFDCFGINSNGDNVCSSHGSCYSIDYCDCFSGYYGEACNIWSCHNILSNSSNVCSESGTCTSLNLCTCEGISGGENCNEIAIWVYIASGATGAICLLLLLIIIIIVILSAIFMCFSKKLKAYKKYDTEIEMIKLEEKETEGGGKAKFELSKKFFQIDQNDIKLTKKLGAGAFAEVFLAKWEGKNVAVKLFQTSSLSGNENSYEDFEKELSLLSSISHPSIVTFHGCLLKPPRIGLVLSYIPNGDISEYILLHQNNIPFKRKCHMLNGIISAMSYLHKRNIIHRDLKCENVLLNEKLESILCDFGVSRVVEKRNPQLTKRIGTSFYMSPEMVSGKGITTKTDVFSFSIIMYCLLLETNSPYGNECIGVEFKVSSDKNYRPIIKNENGFEKIKWYVTLMKKCWNHDPKKRPSFSMIIKEFEKNSDVIEVKPSKIQKKIQMKKKMKKKPANPKLNKKIPMIKKKPVIPKNKNRPVIPKNKNRPVIPKNKKKPVIPKNKNRPVIPKNKNRPTIPKNKNRPSFGRK